MEPDRLGALPDSILRLILSGIPTLDAVRSSVLSRRWRYLWTSVGTLDFKDSVFKHDREEIKFVRFVDKVLHFHHTPVLQKFRLSSDSGWVDQAVVKDWIRIAITREARELDVRVSLGEVAKLPSRLFISHSLVDLNLDLGGAEVKLPAAVRLTGLRNMRLSVTFLDGHLTSKLFSGCPALETLILKDCWYEGFHHLEISCPRLLRLIHVESVGECDDLSSCRVEICAPRLEFFKYQASLGGAYDLGALPSLVEAKVHFHGFASASDFDLASLMLVHKFLQQLSCVKNLRLSCVCVEALSKVSAGPSTGSYITFPHLQRLKMHVGRLDGTVISRILGLMVASRTSLKNLTLVFFDFEWSLSDAGGSEDYSAILGLFPELTSGSVVEEIHIKCCDFTERKLDVVRTLLGSQACLKRFLLSCSSYCDMGCPFRFGKFCSGKLKALMHMVLSFPRLSGDAAVAFLR